MLPFHNMGRCPCSTAPSNGHPRRGPLPPDMRDNRTECLKVAECHPRQILSAGETLGNTTTEVSGEVHQGLLVEQGTCAHPTMTKRTVSGSRIFGLEIYLIEVMAHGGMGSREHGAFLCWRISTLRARRGFVVQCFIQTPCRADFPFGMDDGL